MTNPNEHEQATPTDYPTYNLFAVSKTPYSINGTPVQMELDTGTSLSLLSKGSYEQIPSLR